MKTFVKIIPYQAPIAVILVILMSCSSPIKKRSPLTPIEARWDNFHQCYRESDSYYQSKASGKMRLAYTIAASGNVQDVYITDNDFKDANLASCVLTQMRDIKYPAGVQEKEASYEFNFSPRTF
jgi:hypothetical protein